MPADPGFRRSEEFAVGAWLTPHPRLKRYLPLCHCSLGGSAHHGGEGFAGAERHLGHFDHGRRWTAPRIGEFQELGCRAAAAPGARCSISPHESHSMESQQARHPGRNQRLLDPLRPTAVADLLALLVDLPAAALCSRRGVLFRTIRVSIRWVQRSLVQPAAYYSCRTFYLQWSPVFRFELLNLSISSPMNSEAMAFHQM